VRLVSIAIMAALSCAAGTVVAAEVPRDLTGAWTLVSSVVELAGRKIEPYGASPKGSLILDGSGRYVAMIARAGLPKLAAGTPLAGTAEENKAIMAGTIAHFGSYAVEGQTITFRIEAATFPNWDGAEQTRSYTIASDTLTYTADGGPNGAATLVWQRAK